MAEGILKEVFRSGNVKIKVQANRLLIDKEVK